MKRGLLISVKACKLEFYEHYVLGKKRRENFGSAIHNTEDILNYVHSNVWGTTKRTPIGSRH